MKKLFTSFLVLIKSTYFAFAVSVTTAEVALTGDRFFQNIMTYLFNPILKIITVIAFLYFLYGVMIFIMNKSNDKAGTDINNGKAHLVYGLIGLFIIFSVNGILALLNNTIGGLFGF